MNDQADQLTEYDDPERYRTLKNGAIYDMEAKRIVANPPGGPTTAITQSNAVAMASARWDNYRTRAELGAAAGAKRDTSLDAWQWVVEKQTELAGDTSNGRASTEAARFVAQSLDALPDKRSNNAPNSGVTVQIGADLALKLVELARNRASNGAD